VAIRYEYEGVAVSAGFVISTMNQRGQEGWRVIEARAQHTNGLAELGADAIVLILFERQLIAPPPPP